LRTEIKDIFDNLENRSELEKFRCRYQIPVPITPEVLCLFENNKTELETILSEFLEELKTDYILISDLKSLAYSNRVNLQSLKKCLVRMGIIETTQTYQARGLKTFEGNSASGADKNRYLKLSPSFRQKLYKN